MQEVQEEEAFNLIKPHLLKNILVLVQRIVNSNSKQTCLIKDSDGSMIDARPLLASLTEQSIYMSRVHSIHRANGIQSSETI